MKRFRRVFVIGLLVVAVLVIAVAVLVYRRLHSDTIELGETRGELAFMSNRAGDWDLMLLKPDGTLSNLTQEGEGDDFFFSFAFSGDLITFFSNRGGKFNPAQVNTDGSGLKTMSFAQAAMSVLMEGNIDMDPAWAPGGEKMAWSSVRDFNAELYMGNSDSSDQKRLTNDGGSDTMMAWSPDGTRLVFISDREGQQDVYVLDIASGDLTRLTDSLWDFQPVWSLDGSQILFVSAESEAYETGDFDLVIINADGSNRHVLAEDEVFTGDPTYSPYGGQVAYMSNEEGNWDIYVMDADGSNARRMTDGEGDNMFPAWRPVPADQEADQTEE